MEAPWMELAEPEPDPGPFGDCPPEHQRKVFLALEEFNQRDAGDYGSFSELRKWLTDLERLGGLSREAMLKFAGAITDCLTAERDPDGLVTRESLQQAFVRMGGLKQTVHAMCLRISDPTVVACCGRLLAAAVQGAAHAAEQVASAGSDLRLLLRAIERHCAVKEVAEVGCTLVCHFCSLVPYRNCTDPVPPRTEAHRAAQGKIAGEGALDLIVGILAASVREVGELYDKIRLAEAAQIKEAQIQKEVALAPTVVGRTNEETSKNEMKRKQESIQRVKSNVEVRDRWRKLARMEVVESKIQGSALQALVLLATANAETTRMLTGALVTERAASAAEPAEEPGPLPRSSVQSVPQQARSTPGNSRAGSRRPSKTRVADGSLTTLASIQEQRPPESAETLQAMARSMGILVDVLRGHNVLDRPELACRVCRLISLIAEHHLVLARAVNEKSKTRKRNLEAKFMMDLSKKKSKGVESGVREMPPMSFEPLRTCIKALLATLRAHPDCVPLASAALQALWDLRAVSLEASAACGSGAGAGISEETLKVWRVLLHEIEGKDEIPRASKFLRDALYATEVANARIRTHGIKAEDLVGAGVYLTPRAKADAEVARGQAAHLSGDVVAVDWRDGEPNRRQRRAELRMQDKLARLAAEGGAEGGEVAEAAVPEAAEAGGGPGSAEAEATPGRPSSEASSPETRSRQAGSSWLSDAGGSSRGGSRAGKRRAKIKDSRADGSEAGGSPPLGGTWSRSMGYDAYDTDDLETVWRRPMEATLSRSFSVPAVPPRHRKKHGQLRTPSPATGTSDALDRLLQLEFLESEPGRIRARLTVQPQDRCQQTAYHERLRQLTDDSESSKVVTASMAKDLKREGFLMPRYGMQLRIRKAKKDGGSASERRQSLASLSLSSAAR